MLRRIPILQGVAAGKIANTKMIQVSLAKISKSVHKAFLIGQTFKSGALLWGSDAMQSPDEPSSMSCNIKVTDQKNLELLANYLPTKSG